MDATAASIPNPAIRFLLETANMYALNGSQLESADAVIPLYTDFYAGGAYGVCQAGSYSPPGGQHGLVEFDANSEADRDDPRQGSSNIAVSWDGRGQNGWFEINIGPQVENRPRDLDDFGSVQTLPLVLRLLHTTTCCALTPGHVLHPVVKPTRAMNAGHDRILGLGERKGNTIHKSGNLGQGRFPDGF